MPLGGLYVFILRNSIGFLSCILFFASLHTGPVTYSVGRKGIFGGTKKIFGGTKKNKDPNLRKSPFPDIQKRS